MQQTLRIFAATGALAVTVGAAAPCRAEGDAAHCIALNEQGLKLRESRRLREAREQFLRCAATTCPALIQAECERQLKEVTATIPTVVLEAQDSTGENLPAVRVTADGKPLVEHLDGTAIPLDPGVHTFVFLAAGREPVEKNVLLSEGEKERRVRGVFEPPPSLTTTTPPVPTGSPPGPAATAPAPHPWSPQRTVALLSAGVGVGAAIVGTAFGVATDSAWSKSQSECQTPTNCPNHSGAVADRATAGNDASVAKIAFAGALVGVAAGAVLWFTAPTGHGSEATARLHVVPVATPQAGALVVRGEF